MDILAEIKAERNARRRESWAAYRKILEQNVERPDHVVVNRAKFLELVDILTLSPADISKHEAALRRCKDSRRDKERLTEIEKQIEAHGPAVLAFQEKQRAAMAALEQEGQPIFVKQAELWQIAQALRERVNWSEGREGDFPELFGLGGVDPDLPPQRKSEEECRLEQEKLSLHAITSALGDFLRAGCDRTRLPFRRVGDGGLSDEVNDQVDRAFFLGVISRSNFPQLGEHPRKGASLAVLKKVKAGAELNKDERKLYDLATYCGWDQ